MAKWQPADDAKRPREELAGAMMQLMVFGTDLSQPGFTETQKNTTWVLTQFGVRSGLMTPVAANKYLEALKGGISPAKAISFHGEQNDDWEKATVEYRE